MDREFFELAIEVPGFGGMTEDVTGRNTIFLKDPSVAPTAVIAIRKFIELRGGALTGSPQIATALYDWRELYNWRLSLNELIGKSGVVDTDIDESTNRITIGIAATSARQFVLNEVDRRGIPAQAVEFTTAGFPEPLATLQQKVRPVAGGLQIIRPNAGACTLGFIGISNSAWMVTNSHCTSSTGVADGVSNSVPFYQPTVSSTNFIATEQIDPAFFVGGSCPAGLSCRWSDSALSSFGTGNYAQGKIKRTSGPNNGSLTIVGDFRIIEERAYPDLNMSLNKVGRTTGWTQGPVTQTCVTTTIGDTSNKRFLCQDKVNLGASGGDSGSPMFRILSGNDIQLVGILWGRDNVANRTLMSAMTNVEYETLELNTCDPAIPTYFCVF